MGMDSFNKEITDHYHQTSDHADTLDYDYLNKFVRAYILAGRKIANDPVKTSWIKGDKYDIRDK